MCRSPRNRAASPLLLSAVALLIGGCATQDTPPGITPDPLEPVNRVTYQFNDAVDTVLLKPVARGYKAVTPSLVRQGVGNFFTNLGYPFVIFNNLLQGKPGAAVSDTGRLLINTTVGLGGILDVASDVGLEKHNEDLGQTLAVWGVPAGPYVVLPFLGPATLRDAVSRPADIGFNGLYYVNDRSVRDKLFVLEIIDMRARLLPLESQIEASTDPYLFVRESYLQRREFLIYDGNPPEDDFFEEEFLDEE